MSNYIDALTADGPANALVGREASDVLGAELFGLGGAIREALATGQRREGFRALLRAHPTSPARLVNLTAAPLRNEAAAVCDPETAYFVVVRPAEEEIIAAGTTILPGLVARSPAMLKVVRLIENLEQSDATLLLTGESGTGKEVVARALHAQSPRRSGAFVAVNCGAIPADLLESELFGHAKGALAGAVKDRVGRFEMAQGGTIFLDEVGELPLALQVKLLRILQEHAFERVGETETRTTDARIIAATNVDLRRGITSGAFREDLYYRLRVVPIELPPLRSRREDIEPLARYLLARVSARHGRDVRFGPDALRAILAYSWPGNVREMENALEYALTVCKGQTILAEDLPEEVSAISPIPLRPGDVLPFEDPHERERLRVALEAHGWRRDETAHALGMSRTTLWRKMRELGLARPRLYQR